MNNHSIFYKGPTGSFPEQEVREIAKGFDYIDITDLISPEFISNLVINVPTVLVINISKLDEKKQNILLKLYEEPNDNTYIILYGQSCIDTLLTRSYVINAKKYTKEELRNYTNNELVLKYCENPGQIKLANNIEELVDYCIKLLTKISKAPLYNVLSTSDKVAFNNEKDKFNLDLFLIVLQKVAVEQKVSNTKNELIQKLVKYINLMNNKKQFFENFLINLWRVSQCK